MKNLIRKIISLLVSLAFMYLLVFSNVLSPVFADDKYQLLKKKRQELEKALQMSINATQPLEQELGKLETKLKNIQAGIQSAEQELILTEESIKKREADFEKQYVLLAERVERYYKRLRAPSQFLVILSAKTASGLTKDLTYRNAIADEDKKIISQIGQELLDLEKDKVQLEKEKEMLADLKAKTDEQAAFFRKEIKGAKDYQQQLSGEIADLIAQQQALLAQKTGTFQTSVGDVPLSDDPASRPDYNPGFSPAFAAFSFGAPHFKGMSQYGAYGRAKSGQSVEQILKAYYGNGIEIKKDYSTSINITVEGYGTVDIETYVKRIYEMPSSWIDNDSAALKAQAVAARSYALARTNNGASSICATEACQVYKPTNKGGTWDAAVDATRGWVLMANGQPFSAWYASTSGGYQEPYSHNGYSTPGFWDTANGRDGWTSQAYEKTAESPWFYKGWYKSRSGTSCGRSHPWLTSEEMADLVNAAVVYERNKGNDEVISHIWQLDDCYSSDADIWSKEKMREEGAGVTSVSGVSVVYSNAGFTAKVVFQTNKGTVEVEGTNFYKAFNRRAPGAIHLKSGLFNIEKK